MNRVINKYQKVSNIRINKKNIEENKLQFWIWKKLYIYIYWLQEKKKRLRDFLEVL